MGFEFDQPLVFVCFMLAQSYFLFYCGIYKVEFFLVKWNCSLGHAYYSFFLQIESSLYLNKFNSLTSVLLHGFTVELIYS